jgi:hypothetical protein
VEDVGRYTYFMAILSILLPFGICTLWSFGICYSYLVHFPRFGRLNLEKYGSSCSEAGLVPIKSYTKLGCFGMELDP